MSDKKAMQAMVEQCRKAILANDQPNLSRPERLQSEQLIWMCDRLIQKLDSWNMAKANRWVHLIQSGMSANV